MSLCGDCGHEHAGKDLAFICIGCPCEARPGQKEPAQKPTTSRQDYETPRDFLDAVEERFGPLTADLACTAENAKANASYHEGNAAPWPRDGVLWLNPPFGDIGAWAKRCAEWEPRFGGRLLMLTPASIGSNWFRDYVLGNALVLGLNPRITFAGCKDPYPKDLMLSVFGAGPGLDVWRWKPAEARRADAPACYKVDDEQAMDDEEAMAHAIAIAYPRADHRARRAGRSLTLPEAPAGIVMPTSSIPPVLTLETPAIEPHARKIR